jgi:hypothetical protein
MTSTRYLVWIKKHGNVSRHPWAAYDDLASARAAAARIDSRHALAAGWEIERVETSRKIVEQSA